MSYKLIQKHRKSGVLIDTNLLLLLLIGTVDEDLISKFDRTRKRGFSSQDFRLLEKLIAFFANNVVTTPNVLTEASNLSRKLYGAQREKYFERFNACIQLFSEKYHPSKHCADHPDFGRLGLTDISILRIAEKEILVLTDDFELARKLEAGKVDVLNFNNVRAIDWSPTI